jgi:hypothetical protein
MVTVNEGAMPADGMQAAVEIGDFGTSRRQLGKVELYHMRVRVEGGMATITPPYLEWSHSSDVARSPYRGRTFTG